jgi:PEGA domain
MKKTAKTFGCAASLAVLFIATAWGGEHREYPVTLKVLRTNAISTKVDGSRITTTCTSASPNEITCDSTEVSAAQHTELYSLADASDGKLYLISCVLGAGRRFLSGFGQGMAANAGVATVSGCAVPPGTYKARWDKGRLKVAHEKNGQYKETTFVVLSSGPMPSPTPSKTADEVENQKLANPENTLVLFSSVPPGAEIGIDGSFVGHTPSSIPMPIGEHSVRITKIGYKPWERKVRSVGGEVTIAAELEAEPK